MSKAYKTPKQIATKALAKLEKAAQLLTEARNELSESNNLDLFNFTRIHGDFDISTSKLYSSMGALDVIIKYLEPETVTDKVMTVPQESTAVATILYWAKGKGIPTYSEFESMDLAKLAFGLAKEETQYDSMELREGSLKAHTLKADAIDSYNWFDQISDDQDLLHPAHPVQQPYEPYTGSMDRNVVTKLIKSELKRRSGKTWSVTGGRGTAYGWITITAPSCLWMTPEQCQELATLLGLSSPVHPQGESIMASHTAYLEYIDRAKGQTPQKIAEPYWD